MYMMNIHHEWWRKTYFTVIWMNIMQTYSTVWYMKSTEKSIVIQCLIITKRKKYMSLSSLFSESSRSLSLLLIALGQTKMSNCSTTVQFRFIKIIMKNSVSFSIAWHDAFCINSACTHAAFSYFFYILLISMMWWAY